MDRGQHKKPHRIQSAKQQASDQEKAINRDRQKEKMLISAAQLFSEKGIAETTLDEIAAGVGLTKPRVYFHFKDKREILNTCIDRALCQWKAAIDEIQASGLRPGEAALRAIVERYAEIAFQDFGICMMFNGINSLSSDEREAFSRQKADADTGFKSLFADAIPQEMLSRGDCEFLWLAVMSLVNGIAMMKEPPADRQQILSRALDLMLAGSRIKKADEISI
jgi:long-chain acyl-CoA synthetase